LELTEVKQWENKRHKDEFPHLSCLILLGWLNHDLKREGHIACLGKYRKALNISVVKPEGKR
jgi:hypothetical protein